MSASTSSRSGFGHAAAAEENRKQLARVAIVEAIARLGIPRSQWPDFIEAHNRSVPHPTPFRQLISPARFKPPVFDRLNESPREWKKKANAMWAKHRDEFLQGVEVWVKYGVDEKVAEKSVRGPGKSQRPRTRQNTVTELRYEWAALRSCGEAWKEIAARYKVGESAVVKAASTVLRTAGWPTKPKPKTNGTSPQ